MSASVFSSAGLLFLITYESFSCSPSNVITSCEAHLQLQTRTALMVLTYLPPHKCSCVSYVYNCSLVMVQKTALIIDNRGSVGSEKPYALLSVLGLGKSANGLCCPCRAESWLRVCRSVPLLPPCSSGDTLSPPILICLFQQCVPPGSFHSEPRFWWSEFPISSRFNSFVPWCPLCPQNCVPSLLFHFDHSSLWLFMKR